MRPHTLPLLLLAPLLAACADTDVTVPAGPAPAAADPVEVAVDVVPDDDARWTKPYDLEVPPAWNGPGLPDAMAWSQNQSFYPDGANAVFATSDGCALCHSVSPRALAMRTDTGEDISSWGTWRGTLMAQAYVDPYWRAAVAQAVAHEPARGAEIETECLRCHGPMASHTARLSAEASPRLVDADLDPLAYDGVSCTACHQALPTNFGQPASFSGHLDIRPGRAIFGPYEDPVAATMVFESRFTPTHGPHVQDAALCGSCHTLETRAGPDSPHFLEQATYLEWRNSDFTTEPAATPTSQTCQQCHMPLVEDTAIARDDGGGDLNILARSDVRSHTIVGGNAFMLDMLHDNHEELLVEAHPTRLRASALASRNLLRTRTADLHLSAVALTGGRLNFDVRIENLTGHKLPTGYPSRRMWLRVRVLDGDTTVFASGEIDAQGRLVGVVDERSLPHRDVVTEPSEVPVWEMIATDPNGSPTTVLTAMTRSTKDTRLLPRGWTAGGPSATRTAPVGISDDDDFVAGSDTVSYRIPLAARSLRRVRVEIELLYQPIPPAWVDPLRAVEHEAAERFVRMYDAATQRTELIDRIHATLNW